MFKIKKLVLIVLGISTVAVLASSCGGSGGDRSRTTGWEYNNPETGGFEVAQVKDQITGPGLVLIEGGTFTMGSTEESPFSDWDNVPRKVTVSSFYIDQTEVSNLDYREYIFWLNRVYGEDYPAVIQKALP